MSPRRAAWRRRSARRARASAIWSRSRSRSIALEQLDEALQEKADAVLLDNMGPEQLAEAVRRIAGRAIAEASGRITPATAPAIAASGVDLISAGWLTHSAQVLDIGLDWRRLARGGNLEARPTAA